MDFIEDKGAWGETLKQRVTSLRKVKSWVPWPALLHRIKLNLSSRISSLSSRNGKRFRAAFCGREYHLHHDGCEPNAPVLKGGSSRPNAVFNDLCQLAKIALKRDQETYMRLVGNEGGQNWQNRGHFFAAAAEAMRRILVESARRKARIKHGGELKRIDFTNLDVEMVAQPEMVLAIDDPLERFAKEDALCAELVKLRYFAGLSVEEAGNALSLSRASTRSFAASSNRIDSSQNLPRSASKPLRVLKLRWTGRLTISISPKKDAAESNCSATSWVIRGVNTFTSPNAKTLKRQSGNTSRPSSISVEWPLLAFTTI